MPFFNWDPATLGLKVEEMDEEHQTLISLMNQLHDKHVAKASHAEIAAACEALAKFTVSHFSDEEAYMQAIEFPGIGSHKLIHKQLLEKLGAMIAAFKSNPTAKLDADFFGFLNIWLKAHIMGIDTKYAEHAHTRTHKSAS